MSVLFVEDEPDIRFVVSMALALDADISLTAFESGIKALAELDLHAGSFDVALLNIKLPAMTGLELMQRLRARPGYERLPVVFITSSIRPQDVQHYFDQGANGMIEKPFDPMTLAHLLRGKMTG